MKDDVSVRLDLRRLCGCVGEGGEGGSNKV